MSRLLNAFLAWLGRWRGHAPPLAWLGHWRGHAPPGSPSDPYARTPEPRRPRPSGRSGAVAVAEPDE